MTTPNSYEAEIAKIDLTGARPAHILLGCEGTVTKTLNINPECAAALINALTAYLLNRSMGEKVSSAPPEPAQISPDAKYALFIDRNGNKRVSVDTEDGAFSIPTCGNLPNTHRHGITSDTAGEVREWVNRYGTARQRKLLGIA